ncbi:CU044_2847 family protein [Myceligenerans crystallogenes]|uniref:Trypsin-co-occurring domain-containing protein n=1 Tax=Myceligenerans crystallogenes TaxID=316335 RepID=A0ABN2N805_9MICO
MSTDGVRVLEFPVDDDAGTTDVVLVEVAGPAEELAPASGGAGAVGRAARSVAAALDAVTPTAHAVARWAREAGPDEVTVEFGLRLGATTSAVITSGTSEVNFAVTMTWRTDR